MRELERLDPSTRAELERYDGRERPFVDTDGWAARLHELKRLVCQVRMGTGRGTGFLVGPDLVLTNEHVIRGIPRDRATAAELSFVFDYAVAADESAPAAGETFVAAENWCVALSDSDHLDFALVRLERRTGRDYVDIPPAPYPFADKPGLTILQHPLGAPVKHVVSATEKASLEVGPSLVHHGIPTDNGSSGSPVFAWLDWTLVGLHAGNTGERNYAIEISAIGKVAEVAAAIRASIAAAPPRPTAADAEFARAVALLGDANLGERTRGRSLLQQLRRKHPDRPLPEEVRKVVLAQCEDPTAGLDERRRAWELARALGLAAELRPIAAALWFVETTPEPLLDAMAPVFAEDAAGFEALCDLLRSIGGKVPSVRRVETVLVSLRDRLQLGGISAELASRARGLATAYQDHETLGPIVAKIFYDTTGNPPPPRPATRAQVVLQFGIGAVILAALAIGWWTSKSGGKKTASGSVPDAAVRIDAAVESELIDAGRPDRDWTALPVVDPDAPTYRYHRVAAASDLPATPPEPGVYRVHMIDVGSGLSILVEGNEFVMLYDGGSSDRDERSERLIAYLAVVARSRQRGATCLPSSFSEPMTITHLVLSHAHVDHLKYLADVLKCFAVADVWDTGRPANTIAYREFLAAVQASGATYHTVNTDNVQGFSEGQWITLSGEARMRPLHARVSPSDDLNDDSLVLRVELGRASLLLMGDAGSGATGRPEDPPGSVEADLIARYNGDINADILQVGHHGSRRGSRKQFLRTVSPLLALISAGPKVFAGNVVTAQEVVQAVDEARGLGAAVLTTMGHDAGDCDVSDRIGPDEGPGGCDSWLIEIRP